MAINIILAGFAFLAVAQAADSPICCTPKQWEGVEGIFGGYATRWHVGLELGGIKVSYDAEKGCVAAQGFMSDGKRYKKFHVLQDFAAGKEYISWRDECLIRPIKGDFREACIPGDSRYHGAYSLGVAPHSVEYYTFGIEVKHMPGVHVYAEVVSAGRDGERDLCAPLSESLFGYVNGTRHGPVKFIQTVGFSNVTVGISDPSVFNKPSACVDDAGNSKMLSGMKFGFDSFFGY